MNRSTRAGRYLPALLLPCLATLAASARAEAPGSRPASWEPRVAMARSLSPAGRLLINEQPGQRWRSAGNQAELHSRDLLMVLPGMQARLGTTTPGVELTLWGNLPELSDFYGLQSAVILHDSRSFDLDFTLQQGRVIVANRKDKGRVRVWVRIEGAAFEVTLDAPGDAICLGLNSYWPRGVPFTLTPRAEDTPVRRLNFLVIKGQSDVKVNGTLHSLSAPPGPASYHWDSLNGPARGKRDRRQIDAWADLTRKPPAGTASLLEAIERYQTAVKDREPRTALFDLLDRAANERQREASRALAEFALFSLVAIHDIDRVMQALEDSRRADIRRAAVLALRHWIGSAPGRDRQLYQFLIERQRYAPAQARTVLHLLHDTLPADEADTYELLIAYLRHEKSAIRELAWQRLSHLVPEDLQLPYDATAAPEERARAYEAWKKRIPSGSLPSRKPKQK